MLAVVSGDTDIPVATPAETKSYVDTEKLRPISLAAPRRSDAMPSLLTMAESDFSDFVLPTWLDVFAPAGVRAAVAKKIGITRAVASFHA
jgi:tripartite-type tricarboxylate transporter receptor subunit TctC